MSQTLLSIGPAYILTPAGVTQGQLDKSFTASDPVNGNSWTSSGKDLLIVWNTDVVPQTFGIQSAADQFGRYANIAAPLYSIAANSFAVVDVTSQAIYTQPNGQVWLTSSSALVKFLVLQGS